MIRNISIFGVFFVVTVFVVLAVTGKPVSSKEQEQEAQPAPSAWNVRCDEAVEGKVAYCEVFQRLVVQDTKQRITEFAIGYPADSKEARGVVILPLGIMLPPGVTMAIDDGESFGFKIRYCAQTGCYAFINLNDDLLKKLRKGNGVTLTFKAMNGKKMAVKMSLKGFTKALRDLS